MSLIERIQQKSEGQRRFLMLLSMAALSFLVLAVAWKSFERNLEVRLGSAPAEEEGQAPGLLQSLAEDVKRITPARAPRAGGRGEEPLVQESGITNQESRGVPERIFSVARETRRVVKYNAHEIYKWVQEVIR